MCAKTGYLGCSLLMRIFWVYCIIFSGVLGSLLAQYPLLNNFYAILHEHWGEEANSQPGLMNVSDDDGEDGDGPGALMPAGEGAEEEEHFFPVDGGAMEVDEGEGGRESVEGEGGEEVGKGEVGDVVEAEDEGVEAAGSDELPTLPYPPSSIPLDKPLDPTQRIWIQERIDSLKKLGGPSFELYGITKHKV